MILRQIKMVFLKFNLFRPRVRVIFTLLVFITFLSVIFHLFASSKRVKEVKCHHNEEETRKLLFLAASTNRTLSSIKISHFLCYSTLWAAIDTSRLKPWQDMVEFCAFNEEISSVADENSIRKQFFAAGLNINYVDRFGYYEVTDTLDNDKDPDSVMTCRIYLFERFTDVSLNLDEMRRIGWEHRIMPAINGFHTMNTFPLWIVEIPLDQTRLNGLMFPAPRGGMEINKYLEPDTWWRDQTPKKCRAR